MRHLPLMAAAAVLSFAGVAASAALTSASFQVVTAGLTNPVFVTAPAGDTARLFVVERVVGTTGRIRIINLATNGLFAGSYLTIPGIATGGEQGLLGMAFHPAYATNGHFFVYYVRSSDNAIVLARYTVSTTNPNVANPASALILKVIPHAQATNHNGGWIGFGPDGYLYVAVGDGGGGNDSTGQGDAAGTGNARDITNNLLGKMLRLDIDAAAPYIPPTNPFVGIVGDDEIWAYGLRNPYRDSFDRETGELWIADVGQSQREEINVQAAASAGGTHYGWRCYEGTRYTNLSTAGQPGACVNDPTGLTFPIYEYDHSGGKCSITGGYVYRGCRVPSAQGLYFFGDFCTGQKFTLDRSGGGAPVVTDVSALVGGPANVYSFGEDAAGELYTMSSNTLFRLTSTVALPDADGDGIPDSCEGPGCGSTDFDGDGDEATDADIEAFFSVIGGTGCPTGSCGSTDFNGDGDAGTDADIEAFFRVIGGLPCEL